MSHTLSVRVVACCVFLFGGYLSAAVFAQLIDRTKAPNTANEGIARPLIGGDYPSQIGDGRTGPDPNTSLNVIAFDPFRAIRRGRQLFQRKFTRLDGNGPNFGDGSGNVEVDLAIGAGLSDSCASCHGGPRGGAGFGGDVATRPDSRDAPHLYGLGLKEMLGDEITGDLRTIRDGARAEAKTKGAPVVRRLVSKGISFGRLRAMPDGAVDSSNVEGIDDDLRVRPFFAHGGATSIREFIVGALKNEMGSRWRQTPISPPRGTAASSRRQVWFWTARKTRSIRRPMKRETSVLSSSAPRWSTTSSFTC